MKRYLSIVLGAILCMAAFMATGEQVREEKIPVQLEEVGQEKLTARIKDMKPKAITLGLEGLRLIGTPSVQEQKNKNKQVRITWNTVAMGEYEVSLRKAFISHVAVREDIKKDDRFLAKGEPAILAEAIRQLQNMAKDTGKEKKEEKDAHSRSPDYFHGSRSGTVSTAGMEAVQHPNYPVSPPSFSVTKDPVIANTTEGCDIRVDLSQMVAVVQERTLEDGKEVSPCSDTLTRYPVTKDYNSCPAEVKQDEQKVYEQFTLGYINPDSGGRVEVQPCQPDPEQYAVIVNTSEGCFDRITEQTVFAQVRSYYELHGVQHTVQGCHDSGVEYAVMALSDGCGIRHDFSLGKSWQQQKRVYTKDSQVTEVEECKDNQDMVFSHQVTRDSCQSFVNGNTVIFSARSYIIVQGQRQYITECLPETSAVVLEQEPCAAPQYVHDFVSGQSFRNVNYFYYDNGQKTEVRHCVSSEEAFTHYYDNNVCQADHDDTTKTSQVYAKTYISENNTPEAAEKTYITGCYPKGSPVPYAFLGNKWRLENRHQAFLKNDGFQVNIPHDYAEDWRNKLASTYNWHLVSIPLSGYSYWVCDDRHEVCTLSFDFPLTSTGPYCLSNRLAEPWVTQNNVTLDVANSDEKPQWDLDQDTLVFMEAHCKDRPDGLSAYLPAGTPYSCAFSGDYFSSYNCTDPVCTVSTLVQNPVYQRLDASEYVDTATVMGRKHVCGQGTKLEGKVE